MHQLHKPHVTLEGRSIFMAALQMKKLMHREKVACPRLENSSEVEVRL